MTKDSEIGFFPAQEQFLRGDKRYYGYISGVGAGKTFVGNWRTWLNMEKWNEGEMGAIVAPTRQMIVNVIIPEMRDLGFLERWEYNSSYSDEPGLHSPNGSRALLLSADNKKTIERLRGLNLAWWHIDEKTAVPRRAQQILEQRLRVGNYRNGYITTTPKGKDDTYDFFVGDVDADVRQTDQFTTYESEDRMAIVGVPTDANPHTPDDYKAAMKKDMPDDIRAQEVEGQFVEIGAGVYQRDSFTFVDRGDIDPSYDLEYILGVDPATVADNSHARQSDSDYWAATLCALHRNGGTLYAVDCKRERGLSLTEGAEWVAAIAQEAGAKVLVESNQAQRWLAQELADYNLSVSQVQTSRNKEDKLIGMSIPIENGVVQFVNHEVDAQLGYDPRWQDLIQEALSFPEGDHDDLLDSLNLVVDSVDIGTADVLTTDMYGRESDE